MATQWTADECPNNEDSEDNEDGENNKGIQGWREQHNISEIRKASTAGIAGATLRCDHQLRRGLPSSSRLAASTSLSSPIMPQDAAEDVLFYVIYQFLIGNPNSPPQSPLLSNGNRYSYSSASSPGDISPDLDDLSMLNTFKEATLSTPLPHSPSMQVGAYNTYTHTQHTRGHEQRCCLRPSLYDIPPAPGLICNGDKGYTDSLLTSPLDLTFGNVHTQSVGMSAADNICGALFGHVAAAAATAPTYPNSFDVGGMSGVGAFATILQEWNGSLFGLLLATNLTVTVLISLRVWYMLRVAGVNRQAFRCWRVLLIIIESGMIYSVALICKITLYFLHSPPTTSIPSALVRGGNAKLKEGEKTYRSVLQALKKYDRPGAGFERRAAWCRVTAHSPRKEVLLAKCYTAMNREYRLFVHAGATLDVGIIDEHKLRELLYTLTHNGCQNAGHSGAQLPNWFYCWRISRNHARVDGEFRVHPD
ncbi:hypothetical protein BC835DRAFT_1430458 [Cytidiella melzeri]|nr:hypothetical protein BC835DRAFT_1430458 [Cytidiella melzeri]